LKTIRNRLPFRRSAVLPFFDLTEIIPQEGGFFVPNIERNELDVYEVEMNE